jgi:hypothetical protein
MGEKATIRIERIDEDFRVPNIAAAFGESDTTNTVLWITPPVTQEQADEHNQELELRKAEAQKLAEKGDKKALAIATNLQNRKKAVAKEGVAYTVRRCALRACYANSYPLLKGTEPGKPGVLSEEDKAMLHYIGSAFSKAGPGRGVLLTKGQVKLLRDKAYELGPHLSALAYGQFIEALDYATGDQAAFAVETLEPETTASDGSDV